jgi:hypothetical protein
MTTVGYVLLTATTRFYLLLLIACGPLATTLAGFPQLFALAKGHLSQVGADTAERGIAMIRGIWSKAGSRHWISFGFLAFTLYFLVATWSPSVAVLLGAQVLHAVGIGLIGYQGISYIQALMPNQVGIAAALFPATYE